MSGHEAHPVHAADGEHHQGKHRVQGEVGERVTCTDTTSDAILRIFDVIWTTPQEVLGVLPVMLFWVSGSTPNTAIPLLWELCPSVSF